MLDKIDKIGQASAVGSFHLFVGVAISTFIMAFGTLILARLMLPEQYGLYSVALIPQFMIGLFGNWGVGSAMTKYIAQLRCEGRQVEINDIIATGIIFEIVVGSTLTALSFLLANLIGTTVFQRPASSQLIAIASLAIISGALQRCSQSIFVGFERMELSSATMILNAAVKTVAGPLLVLLGYGVLGAVIGYSLSLLIAGIVGLVMVYRLLSRFLTRIMLEKERISKNLKTLLSFGMPMATYTLLLGFLVQFYGFMMAIFCTDTVVGNYKVATNFAIVLTFISVPISTVLFPAFSKLHPQNEKETLRRVFILSVRYTCLLIVPATIAMMVLATPMVYVLFGEKYTYAPYFLTLYVTGTLVAVLGSLSLGSFFAGVGETRMLMKQGLLTLMVGLLLGGLLIPRLGILGVIVVDPVAGLPSLFWGLYRTRKRYGITADLLSSAKILVASLVAAIPSYLFVFFLNANDWIRLLIGAAIYLAVYVLVISATKAIRHTDIENFRSMFSGLGFVSKCLKVPLSVLEKLARE